MDTTRRSFDSEGASRKHRLSRYVAGVITCSLLFMGSVHAGTVVTNSLISQTTQTQTNIPVTFGQIFKAGDVPSGETLSATLDGQPVTLQVDAKATNPDGSLRHAVLTALIPTLAGNTTVPLTISTASPSTSGTPVTLAQLLATQFDATASLNIGGTVYTADAKQLLQAAQSAGSCKPWGAACNVWLSGPLVSEWIVGGSVKTSGGTASPNVNVFFNVRAYAGATSGSIAYLRVNIVVENTWAYTPQAQPVYTATLTSGSATYTSPALTQYAYTRWHQVLWFNNVQPSAYLREDTQYIQSTGAVSRYEVLQPDDSFLSSVRQFCAPLDYCDQTQTMGNTGAQPAIGPLPHWTSTYIIDPDYRAYNWMLANTDALGAYSIHYRDQSTGAPVSIVKHPYVTSVNWAYANSAANGSGTIAAAYKADLLPNCVNDTVVTSCTTAWFGTGNPDQWDNAHQPAEAYVPYMVSGSFYYMEEVAFGASNNEIWPNETYRGLSQGLIDASHSQVRGKAWVLREMADAAYLLPDTYPLKAEFTADVNNSLNDFNTTYTNNPNANALGIMNSSTAPYSINGGTNNAMAPWQHNFLTWSAGHAADLGFAGAGDFRNWLAKFEIGLMTDWQTNATQGYCWLEASAYNVEVKDASGNFLPNFTSAYDATFPSLVGLTCNSPTMLAAMGVLEGQAWQAGEMHGYPNSATGYPANLQTGLASAADSGLTNGQSAWKIFQGRSVQPSGNTAYNDYPNFALLPRFLPYTPIVNIYASPNPVSATGSSTTLYWNASNATSCSTTWTSSTATSGQVSSGAISATTAYPITCTGPNGTTSASASVSIATATTLPPSNPPPTDPPSATTGGGGGLGWLGLMVLISLMGWLRVKRA